MSDNTMRAVRVEACGEPEVMEVRDVPVPDPGPDQVRVRLAAAGVNPVDTYIRLGKQGYAPTVPYTPGIDGSGTIDAVGPGVPRERIGERVWLAGGSTGTYAECAVVEADRALPLPEGVDFKAGACLYIPYGTAFRALVHKGRGREGESLLVHGASGAVGIAALQWARRLGLAAWGTAGSPEGRKLVEAQGVRGCLDHHDPEHLEELREASGGRGIDLIAEMLADVNLGNDLAVLAPAGRVAVIGSRGDVTITPRNLMTTERWITGVRLMDATPDEFAEMTRAVNAGLRDGDLSPPVQATYSLDNAPRAHREVIEGPHAGNIVLECG